MRPGEQAFVGDNSLPICGPRQEDIITIIYPLPFLFPLEKSFKKS